MTDSDDSPPFAPSDWEQYEAAYDAYEQGKYALACELLQPIVLEYPENVPLNRLYVSCLLRIGRNFAANAHVQRIYRDNPQDTAVLLLAANTYQSIGKLREYRKIVRDIVALGGEDCSSLFADAHLKKMSGSFREAYEAYVRVLGDPMVINRGTDPGGLRDAEYRDQIFIPLLVELGRIGDAQILVEKSLMLFPESKYVLLSAAYVAKGRKDFRGALAFMSRAKAVAPSDPHIAAGLSNLSLRCFRFRDALRYFLEMLRLCMDGVKLQDTRDGAC